MFPAPTRDAAVLVVPTIPAAEAMLGQPESAAGEVQRDARTRSVPVTPASTAASRLALWATPLRRAGTPALAFVGFTLFVSGLFVLVAAGSRYPWLTYLFVLGGAAALAAPLLFVTALVAASEALLGRAWANGLRPLAVEERAWRATARRGLRYGAVLWLANGAAFWLATVVAQLA